jgi:hypothetical protein
MTHARMRECVPAGYLPLKVAEGDHLLALRARRDVLARQDEEDARPPRPGPAIGQK